MIRKELRCCTKHEIEREHQVTNRLNLRSNQWRHRHHRLDAEKQRNKFNIFDRLTN